MGSLPKQIGDNILIWEKRLSETPSPIADATEKTPNVIEVLVRADVNNSADVYLGDANQQLWTLAADQSISIAITRRNVIYVRGSPSDKVVCIAVVSSGVIPAPAPPPAPARGGPRITGGAPAFPDDD